MTSHHSILNLARRFCVLFTICVAVTFCSGAFAADPVFKSVGPGGTVSYGDKPASGAAIVEEVPIEAGPSPWQMEEARQQSERIKQSADAMERERLAKEAVLEKARKEREMEQQFQAELENEIKQAELTAEAQRQARQKELDSKKPKPPKPRPKGPPSTADKAINMRPNAPLLNLPGPAE